MMVCNSAIAQDTKYTIFAKVTLIQKGADYTGNRYRLTITSYLPGEDEAPSYLSEAITKDNVNAYFEYVGSSQCFKMPWEEKDNGYSSYYSDGDVLPPYITEVYIEASKQYGKLEPSDMVAWFVNLSGLKSDKIFGLENLSTANVKNMGNLFAGCSSLTDIDFLSNWDTSNVTNMESMFLGCSSLENINLSKWNTSNVQTMSDMFAECYSLKAADVSGFSTKSFDENQGPTAKIFAYCHKLKWLKLGYDLEKESLYPNDPNNFEEVGSADGPCYLARYTDNRVEADGILDALCPAHREDLGDVIIKDGYPPYYEYCGGYFTVADTISSDRDYIPIKDGNGELWIRREFKANSWYTFVIPFEFGNSEDKEKLMSAFGAKDDDICILDSYDGETLIFTAVPTNGYLPCHSPVLVRPGKDISSLSFINVAVNHIDNGLSTKVSDGTYSAQMIGSYQHDKYIGRDGYWLKSDGTVIRSAGHTKVGTTRCYFKLSDVTETSPAKALKVVYRHDDGTATEIKTIDGMPASQALLGEYNLAGQKVGPDYKGIVISGGKKVIRH